MKKILFKKFFEKTRNRILKSYLSVNYTPKRFIIEENAKCLCLAPHQDDETIGMGGTLARFHENFKVICLTDGARGIKDKPKNEVIEIRKNEFENAMKVAGIKDYEILNIPDRSLIDGYEEFSKINFDEFKYIFIPNLIDQHKDHKAVSALLVKTMEKIRSSAQVVQYEVWSPLGIVNKCIDISDFVETKKKMLEQYSSQTSQRSYFEAAIALSKYRGLAKEMDYAESFYALDMREFIDFAKNVYPI